MVSWKSISEEINMIDYKPMTLLKRTMIIDIVVGILEAPSMTSI